MADSTRSKSNLDRMEEAIAKLASNQLHVTSKLDDIIHRLTTLESSHQASSSSSPSSANQHSPTASVTHLPCMKLDVPHFDGSDPSSWCFKITQFFEYHSTPEPERLMIASSAMEGPALAWFQWPSRNGQLSTWPAFLRAMDAHFAPSQYEDPTGLLCKLTQ